MDAFESVISSLLHQDGYWTFTGFKVKLTKAEKLKIGKPSCPRWELDLLGYKGSTNELLVVECKSYLDSRGVTTAPFIQSGDKKTRYKLFCDSALRKVVFGRLEAQLVTAGFCRPKPKMTLALAAGKIASSKEREQLHALFEERGWRLFDAEWIRERLVTAADGGYENAVAPVTAKLLLRRV